VISLLDELQSDYWTHGPPINIRGESTVIRGRIWPTMDLIWTAYQLVTASIVED
jgi:hypothetical protein